MANKMKGTKSPLNSLRCAQRQRDKSNRPFLKNFLVPIQKGMAIVFLALLFPLFSWAGTVKIIPDTVAAPDAWTSSNADSKWDNVTDGVDAEQINTSVSGTSQRFRFTNASIPADSIIDSMVVHFRALCSGCIDAGNLVIRWRSDGTNNFCDEAAVVPGTAFYGNFTKKRTLFPGAGVCDGALTTSRIDSLNIQLNTSGLSGNMRVTECSVVVWYHPPAGASEIKRLRRIQTITRLISELDIKDFGRTEYVRLEPIWLWEKT